MLYNDSQIRKEVVESLAQGKSPVKVNLNDVTYIMARFFHYAVESMLHGFKVRVIRIFRFFLAYSDDSKLSKNQRRIVKAKYSPKAFGYSFFIVADNAEMKQENYDFITDKVLLSRILSHVSTDIVYKLMKK